MTVGNLYLWALHYCTVTAHISPTSKIKMGPYEFLQMKGVNSKSAQASQMINFTI